MPSERYDRTQGLVDLVHQRHAIGHAHLADLVIGELLELLDEGTDDVPVSSDEHAPPPTQLGRDGALEEGQAALERLVKALTTRQLVRRHVRVAWVIARMVWMRGRYRRRRDAVCVPPQLDLGSAVFSDDICLEAP